MQDIIPHINVPLTVRQLDLPGARELPLTLFHLFERTAIILGAFGGALATRRLRSSRYDVVGILGLGLLSGIGGGVTRDILINQGPPLALEHPSYIAYALLGAALAILFGEAVGPRMRATMHVVDALSLGLFTVAGTTRAANFGLGFLPSMLLGITTAVGGGSLRDLFSGRTPAVLQEGEIYAVVSAIAAAAFLGTERIGIPPERAAIIGTVVGFGLRMLAVRYGWRTRAVVALK